MKLFVADTETTGLDGCLLGDKIVDVGIVCADTEKKTVIPVYSEVVGYDTSIWSSGSRNAWIFSHSDLTLEDVARARPMNEVSEEVRMTLEVTRSAPAEIQDAALCCFAELENRITEILGE